MEETDNNQNTELLNQILNKLRNLEEEIQELKEEHERLLWRKSSETQLNNVWNNKLDEDWSKLL